MAGLSGGIVLVLTNYFFSDSFQLVQLQCGRDGRHGHGDQPKGHLTTNQSASGELFLNTGFMIIVTYKISQQIERDAILVCYDNVVQIVDVVGFPKQSKKYISRLEFSFNIDSIGKFHFQRLF